ncbi:MAG: DUF1189 domain-containing protein [Patescibacteria group bacterium]|nr:DUF1189 domain-containing protein [Patescibacteria group bacterium]
MTFIQNIKSSIYNPYFYQIELKNINFNYSFKYFLKLIFLISFILTIIFSYEVLPKFNSELKNIIINLNFFNFYPKDLIIQISNGELKINQPTPYFIKLPDVPNQEQQLDLNYLLVIDSDNEVSLEKFKNYKTLVLLTKRQMAYYDNSQKIIIQNYDFVKSFVINYEIINSFKKIVNILLKLAIPFIVIVLFIGFLLFNFFKVVYLLFFSFIILLILKILKYQVNYKKAYQIGLHSITLPVLFFSFLRVLKLSLNLNFVFSLITIVIILINFKNKNLNEEQRSSFAN